MVLLRRQYWRTANFTSAAVIPRVPRGARRLYERCGYSACATRLMVKEHWKNEGESWVLKKKNL